MYIFCSSAIFYPSKYKGIWRSKGHCNKRWKRKKNVTISIDNSIPHANSAITNLEKIIWQKITHAHLQDTGYGYG